MKKKLFIETISIYRELMKFVTCSMSLFLADDSAKAIFCEICENSKSRSERPRKAVESELLSTDFS